MTNTTGINNTYGSNYLINSFNRNAAHLSGLNQSSISAAKYTQGSLQAATNALDNASAHYQAAAQAAAGISPVFSQSKLATIQSSIDRSVNTGNKILQNARFDGQPLFNGSFNNSAFNISGNPLISVSGSIASTNGTNIAQSSITTKINDFIINNRNNSSVSSAFNQYYNNPNQIIQAQKNGRNIIADAIHNVAPTPGGATGQGGNGLSALNIGNIIHSIGNQDPSALQLLDKQLPTFSSNIAGGQGFYDAATNTAASATQIAAAYSGSSITEFQNLIKNGVSTDISNISNLSPQQSAASIAVAQDVTQNRVGLIEKLRTNLVQNTQNVESQANTLNQSNVINQELSAFKESANPTSVNAELVRTLHEIGISTATETAKLASQIANAQYTKSK